MRVAELVIQKARKVLRSSTTDGVPEKVSNWIIQGLPGSGHDEVFYDFVGRVRTGSTRIIEVNAGDLRLCSAKQFVEGLIRKLTDLRTPPKQLDDLPAALSDLRERVEALGDAGNGLVFAVRNFDSILKTLDHDGVQHILNTWQNMGSHFGGRTGFIVNCYRDIEDICESMGYSEFHKIFGTNRYRVENTPHDQILAFLAKHPESNDASVLGEAIRATGGFLGEVESVITLCASSGSEELTTKALYELSPQYREWCDILTKEELAVVSSLAWGQDVPQDSRTTLGKLARKGLVTGERRRLTSALFAAFLKEQEGDKTDDGVPFVRASAKLLNQAHLGLMHQACKGWALLEYRLLQTPRDNEAVVYLLTGEDSSGVPYRPVVLKVHKPGQIDEELACLKWAKELLGPVVPSVLGEYVHAGEKAAKLEYASGENRGFAVQQFGEFYQRAGSDEVSKLLDNVFRRVLFPLYREEESKTASPKSFLFLPRVHHGEFEHISRLTRELPFWDMATSAVHLPGGIRQKDLGEELRPTQDEQALYFRLFGQKRNLTLTFAHGDMNPRNLLIDGVGNTYLIDFPLLRDRALRFTDATRLEAEIRFKLIDMRQVSWADWAAINSLLSRYLSADLEAITSLPLLPEVRKTVLSVAAIRRAVIEVSQSGTADQRAVEYNLLLLAQTLRIALYGDYLSREQQQLAIVAATALCHTLEGKCDVGGLTAV